MATLRKLFTLCVLVFVLAAPAFAGGKRFVTTSGGWPGDFAKQDRAAGEQVALLITFGNDGQIQEVDACKAILLFQLRAQAIADARTSWQKMEDGTGDEPAIESFWNLASDYLDQAAAMNDAAMANTIRSYPKLDVPKLRCGRAEPAKAEQAPVE